MDESRIKKRINSSTDFTDKPAVRVMRFLFPIFSRIAPLITAKIALRLFLTPQRYSIPVWERTYVENAVIGTLLSYGKKFRTYSWGTSSKVIVLCHAWGGRGTQLGEFISVLVKSGFRVVAFDAPAHGISKDTQTDMMEYSTAVNEVIASLGKVYGVLGHSFGAGNAFLSWARFHFSIEKIAVIGCFSNAIWITERFGEVLGIPSSTIENMRTILEKRYPGELSWEKLSIGEIAKQFQGELLIVHDTNDSEIPYFHAERLLDASGREATCLYTTNGLGHRRILRDKTVISRVRDFFCTC